MPPNDATALYYQGSQASRQGGVCIRVQWRDLPVGWLTGLVPHIYSTQLSGIVSLMYYFILGSPQRPGPEHAQSANRRSCQAN